MPRTAAGADVFNAIGEARRREILDLLAGQRPHTVGELVAKLRMPQPAVSKHLGILRKVALVSVSKGGRQRLYRLNSQELKPVHDWVTKFERFWSNQLDRIKERAERKMRERSNSPSRLNPKKGSS
jgi:DNA-binding transcriptional ArsR family regulator